MVGQEARVSRAVELMVAHVENLRKQHDRNLAELEEARRVIQLQNSCRSTGDPRASPGWLKLLAKIKGNIRVSVSSHHAVGFLPRRSRRQRQQTEKLSAG